MYKILLVSHNNLASAFVSALEMISGEKVDEKVTAIGLNPELGIYDFEKNVNAYVDHLNNDLLVLCDINFGSPARLVYEKLIERKKIFRLISGLNLSMLITSFVMKDGELDDVLSNIEKEGMESIVEMKFTESKNEDDE